MKTQSMEIWRELLRGAGVLALILVATVAVGLAAAGCGESKSKQTATLRTVGPKTADAVVASAPGQGEEPVGTPMDAYGSTDASGSVDAGLTASVEPAMGLSPLEEGATGGFDASLPPELVADVSTAQIIPGEIVEITAQGSSDVLEVTLYDGIGKTQTLVYDESARLWRGLYRVPLRMSSDRLGLSVTAKNGSDHWRRVWLFLSVSPETAAVDSVTGN